MSTLAETNSIYADSGVTLDAIIYDGKLGGSNGVKKYLEARMNQITNNLAQNDLSETEQEGVMLGIAAMREAINVLGLLSTKAR